MSAQMNSKGSISVLVVVLKKPRIKINAMNVRRSSKTRVGEKVLFVLFVRRILSSKSTIFAVTASQGSQISGVKDVHTRKPSSAVITVLIANKR